MDNTDETSASAQASAQESTIDVDNATFKDGQDMNMMNGGMPFPGMAGFPIDPSMMNMNMNMNMMGMCLISPSYVFAED